MAWQPSIPGPAKGATRMDSCGTIFLWMIFCSPHKAMSTSSRVPSFNSTTQSHYYHCQIISRIVVRAMQGFISTCQLDNDSLLVLLDQIKGGLQRLHLLLLILLFQSSKRQCDRHLPSQHYCHHQLLPPLRMASSAELRIQAPQAAHPQRQVCLPRAQAHLALTVLQHCMMQAHRLEAMM